MMQPNCTVATAWDYQTRQIRGKCVSCILLTYLVCRKHDPSVPGKKRSRGTGQDGMGVIPPKEHVRRQRQRELQQLALKLREQGRCYNPHKCKSKVYKEENKHVKARPSQAQKLGSCAADLPGAEFQVLAASLSIGIIALMTY
jgi:hypothetical protein